MSQNRIHLNAAEAIVKGLRREEVKHIFCVPGESYLPVLNALYDEQDIQVISGRHEGGIAFMAEGYAKASKKPGIVMATRGVGASNLSIGVHTAYQDSTPMVVLLGQVSTKFRGREGFQEVDLERFFRPISKWAVEITDVQRIPEILAKAFRIAKTGRPGPVVISLPEDILYEEGEFIFRAPVSIPRPAPSIKEISMFQHFLQIAKKPLIIAGGGIRFSGAEDALLEFAEAFQIPVMTAFRRHDVFPNNNNLYLGHLGLGITTEIRQAVDEADVIFAFGTRLSEITTQDYSIITNDKRLVHIDISFETIGNVYPPDLGIIADIKEALLALRTINIEEVKGSGDFVWKEWIEKRRTKQIESIKQLYQKQDIQSKIIGYLQQQLKYEFIITNDAGNFAGWLHTYFQFNNKNTYIGPTSGAMGYGVPSAIGAAIASPDKTIISLSGDGGFMMTAQELETAVRYKIGMLSLIFNNQMYGTIRMHQEIHYPKKVIATDLGNISFKSYIQSLGGKGYQVTSFQEFEHVYPIALEHAKDSPVVIEILTDREQISVNKKIKDFHK